MIQVGFYKGKGDIVNKLVRLRTRSEYSHCGIVIRHENNVQFLTSSFRHRGVVKHDKCVDNGQWDFLTVGWVSESQILEFYERTKTLKYDFKGALIGQLLKSDHHDRDKYFCSEWCAEALGILDSWRYSPVDLYNTLTTINNILLTE